MRLSDIQHGFLRQLANQTFGPPPVLAINAGGAATVKTTNAINYGNLGINKTKAALSAQVLSLPTAASQDNQKRITGSSSYGVQPISTTVYYVLCIDAAGNVVTLQGTYAGQTFTPYIGPKGTGFMPNDVGDMTPFGFIKVVTNASVTFTPATTALDAAGLTVTFGDITHVPQADQ